MDRILVTGAAGWLGGAVVAHLERRDGVVVFAVDHDASGGGHDSEWRRLDVAGLDFARYLLDVAPHIVVHIPDHDGDADAAAGVGTLLGAVARAEAVRHLVVVSDSSVYGTGPRHASLLGEEAEVGGDDRRQRPLAEMERAVREASHGRFTATVLRPAPIFGAEVGNPLSRFLAMPVVPTVLGFDPRLQVIHESDALAAVLHAIDRGAGGTFNVAAAGPPLYLSRVLRLGRRIPQPLPGPLFASALRALDHLGLHLPPHVAALLQHGRVMDTTLMATGLGFSPSLTVRGAVVGTYRQMEAAA